MFRERPRLPKKVVIYDTNIVLKYIDSLPEDKHLLLELLTKKLVTLLCILSAQRSQAIGALYEEHMHRSSTTYTFFIPIMLKTTTPSFHQEPLEFEAFPENHKLSVYHCLDEYRERTKSVREIIKEADEKQRLILSFKKPFKAVKSATLARYVKEFLGMAGIDITVFTTHSTRSASSSKMNNLGLSLKDISKAAGWKGDSTFQRFYKFKITKNMGTELVKAAASY